MSQAKSSLGNILNVNYVQGVRSGRDKMKYLSFSKPDDSYLLNKLSQFMPAPSEAHWKVVKTSTMSIAFELLQAAILISQCFLIAPSSNLILNPLIENSDSIIYIYIC